MPLAFALPPAFGDPVVLLAVAVAVVASAVLVVVLLRTNRRPPARTLLEKVLAASGRGWEGDVDPMLLWLPPDQRGDRRKAIRRVDRLTAIRVAGAPRGDGRTADEGLVIDRSSRGLGFACERRYDVGSGLFVRVEGAPEGSPWVAVTVRNSRDAGDHFVIGCEFEGDVPWNLLLLFG